MAFLPFSRWMGIVHAFFARRYRRKCSLSATTRFHKTLARRPPAFMPDSYPHLPNGGEEQDERPQAAFAKRASLSRWFATQEGHHGSVPDSHPGGLPLSRRCPPSWSEASDQSARPTRPASKDQSARSPGALVRNVRPHVPATSARQEATTDPSLRIRPSTGGPCRSSMRQPLLRQW